MKMIKRKLEAYFWSIFYDENIFVLMNQSTTRHNYYILYRLLYFLDLN